MQIFKNKPFMLCCACFIASSIIGFCFIGTVKLVLLFVSIGIALAATALAIFLRKREFRIRFTVVIIAAVMSALAFAESFLYYEKYTVSLEEYSGQTCEVTLTVVEELSKTTYHSEYLAVLSSVNGEHRSGYVFLCFEGEDGCNTESTVKVTALCETVEEYTLNNSSRLSAVSDGIIGAFTVEPETPIHYIELENNGSFNFHFFVLSLNRTLTYKMEDLIGGEEGSLCAALTLGRRDRLLRSTLTDFARCGLSHVLALSGMHMTILAGLFDFILKKLRVRKTFRCGIMPMIMLFYLILTGFSLSTVRAAIMLTAVYIAYISSTPADSMTVLFSSCAFIIAVLPTSVADIGFWMSYLATFGLLLVAPYLSRLMKKENVKGKIRSAFMSGVKKIFSMIAITVTAVFAVLILTQMFFGELSVISPITNLLCNPLITLMFIFGAILLVFGGIPFVASIISPVIAFLGKLVLYITSSFSDMRNITLSLEHGFAKIIVILFTVSTVVLLILKLRRKIFVLLSAAVSVLAFCVFLAIYSGIYSGTSDVNYIRKGEREMVSAVSTESCVLIDMSDGNYSNFVTVWDEAHKDGATEADVLILTHYHSKHIYALARFFDSVKVRTVMMPKPENADDADVFLSILRAAASRGVECRTYTKGESVFLTESTVMTLFPYGTLKRSKQPAFAFEIDFGDERLVYIGSSFFETETGREAGDIVSGADTVIYGTHGPNPKEKFLIDGAAASRRIVFADEEILGMSYRRVPSFSAEEIVCECELFEYRTQKSK